MTVEELLDHFHIMPDTIVFYDATNNIQDRVDIMYVEYASGSKIRKYNSALFNDFLSEYGKREVMDWHYGACDSLDLELR